MGLPNFLPLNTKQRRVNIINTICITAEHFHRWFPRLGIKSPHAP